MGGGGAGFEGSTEEHRAPAPAAARAGCIRPPAATPASNIADMDDDIPF
jgi:hypothetical protein